MVARDKLNKISVLLIEDNKSVLGTSDAWIDRDII